VAQSKNKAGRKGATTSDPLKNFIRLLKHIAQAQHVKGMLIEIALRA